jgi:hypothetical protein
MRLAGDAIGFWVDFGRMGAIRQTFYHLMLLSLLFSHLPDK